MRIAGCLVVAILCACILCLRKRQPPQIRLAIACVTKRPIAFGTWLRHHQKNIGVEHFFICADEPSDAVVETIATSPEWRPFVTLHRSSGPRSYFSIMDRQQHHVNRSIRAARRLGCTHLVHIDDDELLYCPHGLNNMRRALGQDVSWFRVQNIEALFQSSNCVDPFVSTREALITPSNFSAYANGKGIASLKHPDVAAHGPHAFTGRSASVPRCAVVVVHYESACLERWTEKFRAYAKDSPRACTENKIPFPYYCESIASMDGSREEQHAVWRKWKTRARDSAILDISALQRQIRASTAS